MDRVVPGLLGNNPEKTTELLLHCCQQLLATWGVIWVEANRPPTNHVALKVPTVTKLVVRFLKDESGATAIEYGLIAAGVSLAVIGVVSNLGAKLKSTFSSISTQLQ